MATTMIAKTNAATSGKTAAQKNTLYLNTEGGRIAYDVAGAGPLVVCVPSMGDVRGEYRFLAPQLVAAGYRVATMDVRGHGESSTGWDDYTVAGVGRDIMALARELGGGAATIVGASMAAGAAVYAAAEAPELVAGLVLIGPFVRDLPQPAWIKPLYSLMFARPWGAFVWSKYYPTLYPSKKPADFDAYLAALSANLRVPARTAALRKMITASKAESGKRLDRVSAPAIVILGSKDPDFKSMPDEGRFVAASVHGPLHLIEGAGHYPHAEMPEQVFPIVAEFLSRVAAGGGQR